MYPFWVIDMEAIEAIMGRRSIRKYTGEKIPEEDITLLLKAAMNAPSAHNKQPWHFIVVDDRKVLDKVPEYHGYSKMLENASHAIVVLGDTQIQAVISVISIIGAVTDITVTPDIPCIPVKIIEGYRHCSKSRHREINDRSLILIDCYR